MGNFNSLEEICCDNQKIILKNGENVCSSCGTVYGSNIVSQPQRAYGDEEIKKKVHTAPWKMLNNGTTFYLENGQNHKWSYLKKKSNRITTYNERKNLHIIIEIEKFNLPKYIKTNAFKIIKECMKQKLTKGKSIDNFIVGSVFASCELNNYYISINRMKELGEKVSHNISKKIIFNIYSLMIQKEIIVPKSKKKLGDLVSEYCKKLNIPSNIENEIFLLVEDEKINNYANGKSPSGIMGGVIYYFSKENSLNLTQKMISEKLGMTEVTIRNHYKNIKRIINNLFQLKLSEYSQNYFQELNINETYQDLILKYANSPLLKKYSENENYNEVMAGLILYISKIKKIELNKDELIRVSGVTKLAIEEHSVRIEDEIRSYQNYLKKKKRRRKN